MEDGGTAKLFRLEPGAAYPLHQHPDRSEYAYVLAGEPVLFDGETHHACRSGNVVTFPANTPHSLANPGTTEVLLFVGAIIRPR